MTTTSLFDKKVSNEIQLHPGITFYALIMAAIAMADTDNLEKLRTAFPDVHRDTLVRYYAPDGCLNLGEWCYKNNTKIGDLDEKQRSALESLFNQAYQKASLR
jgi:hypothetical protein